jgi:polysaccharide export outer membrane protein
MKPWWTVTLVALCGCYTPKGAFAEVEDAKVVESVEYVISPGDTLQVRVFQQEAMSARVRVRADGKVSLPLVNDLPAAGKTPTALAGELQIRFKDYINNPVVTVSLEESRPLSVSVLGEVLRAGVVTLEPGSGVPAPRRIRFHWDALTRGEGRGARFVLQPGDVVVAE